MPRDSVSEWRKGWPVVLAAALGLSAMEVHINALGPLIQPIQHDTSWSRQQVVVGYTIAKFISVVLQPGIGILMDKVGVRVVASLSLALYGLGLVCVSQAGPEFAVWLAAWVVLALPYSALSVWVTGITGHFDVARGRALAFFLFGASLAGAGIPILTTLIAKAFGWRGALLALTAYPIFIALPVVAAVFKDARFARAPALATRAPPVEGLSAREIMQSRSFWLLGLAGIFMTATTAGFIIHLVPILVDMGSTQVQAAALMVWIGIGAFAGSLAAGFLLDRFPARFVTIAFMIVAMSSISMLMLAINNVVFQSFVVFAFGTTVGSLSACIAYLTGKYFAGKNFGFAYGVMSAALALGAGLGPLLGAMLYDRFHSYYYFELASVVEFAVAALSMLGLGPYPVLQEGAANDPGGKHFAAALVDD